jgi:hypothetical protein
MARPALALLLLVLFPSGCRDQHAKDRGGAPPETVTTAEPPPADAVGAMGTIDAVNAMDATVSATDSGPEVDPLAAAVAALEDAGDDVRVVGIDVAIATVKVTPKGALDDALATLLRQRWRFRACAPLLEPEDASTSQTELTIRIGEGGEPTRAAAPSGPLGDCLAKAARAVVFPEPDGGLASAEVTLRWTRSHRPFAAPSNSVP